MSNHPGPSPVEGTSQTVKVHFSDACSDVLVFLAEAPRDEWHSAGRIAFNVAPSDATDPAATTESALSTLLDAGLARVRTLDGVTTWRASGAGRRAVAEARSRRG